jgi:hypothetical protein
MDVRLRAVAREAEVGDREGLVVGEQLDPPSGPVGDQLSARRIDHHFTLTRRVERAVRCAVRPEAGFAGREARHTVAGELR